MPSTLKSNRRKKKKSKFVQKLKQPWRVRKPTRNWVDLPADLMVNILQRIGVVDILENAQKVCTAWREICEDPSMWRVIHMDNSSGDSYGEAVCQDLYKRAVDRSQGQLVDLTMFSCCNCELLQYVAARSSQLRRLEIVYYVVERRGIWSEVFEKLSLLEELSLVKTTVPRRDIEAAGRYCPLLKTLKVNQESFRLWDDDDDEYMIENETALAVGKNLPELTHLELIGNEMNNIGLQAILDGCCHLESLDIRGCLYVDLSGDLGKRCSQQIKNLKLPFDSRDGYPHSRYIGNASEYYGYSDYDGEYIG